MFGIKLSREYYLYILDKEHSGKITQENLEKCLNKKFIDSDKELIKLRFQNKLSYEEISKITNRTEKKINAAFVRIFTIKFKQKEIRSILEGEI